MTLNDVVTRVRDTIRRIFDNCVGAILVTARGGALARLGDAPVVTPLVYLY
jgi:hypothetical protein